MYNGRALGTGVALRPPRSFEQIAEFLSERFSQQSLLKLQFWYPPQRFGSQHRISRALFLLVFWSTPLQLLFQCGDETFLRRLSPECGSLRTSSTTTNDRNLQFRGTVSTGFFFVFLGFFFSPQVSCAIC